jgi:hypothetical protein
MQDWYDKGFDIHLTLRKGLEWHASVVNAGYAPVPAAWRPRVDEFLKKLGYRMVLRELTHSAETRPGDFPREGAEDTERSSPMSWELSQFRAGEVVEVRRAAGRLRTG